jgi:hypothetical protein
MSHTLTATPHAVRRNSGVMVFTDEDLTLGRVDGRMESGENEITL